MASLPAGTSPSPNVRVDPILPSEDTTNAATPASPTAPVASGTRAALATPESHVTTASTSPAVTGTGTVVATVAGTSNAQGSAYDPQNGNMYVAYGGNPGFVAVISGETYALLTSIPVGTYPWGIAYDAMNGDLYVSNSGSSNMSVIAGSTNTVVATVSTGANPQGVVYDPSNGELYVSIDGTNSVSEVNPVMNTVSTSVGVDATPYGIAYDPVNGDLYVAAGGANKADVLASSPLSFSTRITVQSSPNGVAYDAATGEIFVANSGSASVSVIDPATNAVTSTVAVSATPSGIAYDPANGDLYTGDNGAAAVSVIDGASLTVAATPAVGTNPTDVGVDGGTGEVYVSNAGSGSVSVLSTVLDLGSMSAAVRGANDTGTVIATPSSPSLGVGDSLFAAYDDQNGNIYVSNWATQNLTVLSGATDRAIASIDLKGVKAFGVAYDSANGDLYVVNNAGTNLTVVSGATNQVVGVVNGLSGGGVSVAYDSANQDLYATCGYYLCVVNGTTNTLVTLITVSNPGPVWGVAYDDANQRIYATALSGAPVSVIDGATNTVIFTFPAGGTPAGVTYDGANGDLYVSDSGTSQVSVINADTYAQVATVSVPGTPWGIAYASDNGNIYVPDDSSQLTVVSGATNTVVGAVPVGASTNPFGVAYDPANGKVYSINSAGSSVPVISTLSSTSAPTGAILDVGQTLFLSAPVIGEGAGIDHVTASASPAGGLYCAASTPGLTTATGTCWGRSPGTYTVTLTATDAIGNSVWSSAAVQVLTDPSVAVPVPTRATADVGQPLALSTSAGGGTGTYASYAWVTPPGLGCAASTSNTLTCVPKSPVAAGSVTVNVTDMNNDTSTSQTLSYTVSADPTITTPTATRLNLDVGQSTALSLAATNGTGLWSTLAWSGLPNGCASMNSTALTCTPGVYGTYSVSATVTDSNGMAASSGPVTLVVSLALATPSFTPSRNTLDVNQTILLSATVSGGTGTFVYAWGSLPAGCASSNTASLACTPASAGSGTFATTVTVTDSNGASLTSAPVTLTVALDPTISPPAPTSVGLDVGQTADLSVTATNGTGGVSTYGWQGLPVGCTSADTLTLACTPTTTGAYGVTVSITDSNHFTATSGTLTLVVSPTLTAPSLAASEPSLDVGQSVILSATTTGGSVPWTYIWSGLPSGCVTGNTAVLACSPTSAGSASVSVSVTDANGISLASNALTLTISSRLTAGSVTLSPAVLDLGQGATISASVNGGSGGLTYGWSGLPSGCATSNRSEVTCTPNATGESWIFVTVSDSNRDLVSMGPVTMAVSPALGTPSVTASASSLTLGGSVTFTASVTGGTAPLTYSWTGLPTGCGSANASVLTCVPTGTGTFTASVRVADATGAHGSASAAPVKVTAAPAPASTGLSSGLDWGILALGLVAVVIALLGVILALRKQGPAAGATTVEGGAGTPPKAPPVPPPPGPGPEPTPEPRTEEDVPWKEDKE